MSIQKKKVAIVGSGIAGLASAYFLHRDHDITIFEKDMRAGGHINTTIVHEPGGDVPIDTAVMIFNQANYPNFCRLLDELDVPLRPVKSTIGFQHLPSGLEYALPNPSTIFADRRLMTQPAHLRLVKDIVTFGSMAREILANEEHYAGYTLKQYAEEKRLSEDFLIKYLVPFAAALWSAEPKLIWNYPILSLVHYFDNHHLLGPLARRTSLRPSRYSWRGVPGGAQVYRDKLISKFPKALRLGTGVKSVHRRADGVDVTTTDGKRERFDNIIFACHADEALKLLADPTPLERELLSTFIYRTNQLALHTDASVMPKNRRAWASFNCRIDTKDGKITHLEQHYYLNYLQKLPAKNDYFMAVGGGEKFDQNKVLQRFTYSHPVSSMASAKAQKRLPELNTGRTYFCGSYFRHAFHEDAIVSAIDACRALAGRDMWPQKVSEPSRPSRGIFDIRRRRTADVG